MKSRVINWPGKDMKETARLPWLCAVLLAACFAAPAATRVALVSAGGNPEIQNVQDAALALLSKDGNLEMVERTEIDRVLQEQQLSLAGGVGGNEAVKAGQLLHADLFAVLEGSVTSSAAHSQPPALVVFDAKTGVRYADSELAASNTGPAPSAVADALRAAVAKSRQSTDNLHTVCLLLVRNADLPAGYDRLCDSAGSLLERELTALPDVVVLERARLAHVHQEQQITGADNQLLTSLQMLELDISRDGDGMRGSLRAISADDTSTNSTTATVPTRDSAALAKVLAQKAGPMLSSAPANLKPRDRVAEAERFHREMKTLQEQQEYLGALRAMDAAYALAPEQPGYGLDLLVCLCDGATEYFAPGTERANPLLAQKPPADAVDMQAALACGNRAADHFIEMCREVAATNRPGDPVPDFMRYLTGRVQWRGLLGNFASHAGSLDESTRAGLLALMHKDHVLVVDVQEPFWRGRATNRATLGAYAAQFRFWLASSGYEQLVMQQWRDDKLLLFRRWLDTAGRVNLRDGTGVYLSLNDFNNDSQAYVDLVQSLTEDPDPLLRLDAKVSVVAMKHPGPITDEKVAAFRDLRLQIENELDRGFAKNPGPLREAAWGQYESAMIKNIGTGPVADRECVEVCRFELARNRINLGFLRQTILAQAGALHDSERLQLTDEVLDTLVNKMDPQTELITGRPPAAGSQTNSAELNRQQDREKAIADFQRLHDTFADKVAQQGGTPQVPATGRTSPVNRPDVARWKSTTRLLDWYHPANGFHWLLRPVLEGRTVYEVALGLKDLGSPEDTLQLLKIPLDGGPAENLSHAGPADLEGLLDLGDPLLKKQMAAYLKDPDVAVRFASVGNLSSVSNSANRWMPLRTACACLGGGRYFLGTAASGLLIFPLKGGPVEHLSTSNGLPGDAVLSLAFLDGKLYIGASVSIPPVLRPFRDVGYIVSYDPETHQLETLASSRRSEHLSPFDDQPEFLPFSIQADPGRHRLILGTTVGGFWSFTPVSDRFEQFTVLDLEQPPTFSHMQWLARLDANKVGMMHQSNLTEAAGLNSRTNLTTYIFSVPGEETNRTIWRTTAMTGRPPPVATAQLLLIDGWLWSGTPFQRISYDTDKLETFPPVRSEYQFRATQGLQPLDEGKRLLAADEYSLWILEPSDSPAQNASQNPGNLPAKSGP